MTEKNKAIIRYKVHNKFSIITLSVFYSIILSAFLSSFSTAEEANSLQAAQTSPTISLTEDEYKWLHKHPVISVVMDQGWAPIEFTDKYGNLSGMSVDYLNLIEKKLGVKFKQERTNNWQESYSRLKNHEIDMTTSVAVTPERKNFWSFTKPYMEIKIVILTKTNVTFISSMKELSGKKVAVVEGYMAAELIPHDFPDIQIVKVTSVKQGLSLLQNNQIFAFIDNMLVTSYYLAEQKIADIKIAGETPYINSQCMAVRNDWEIFAGILQKALESISEKERTEIYNKWVPVRYEYGFNYSTLWKTIIIFAIILGILFFWNRKQSIEIKNRKITEAALRESEEKFHKLFDIAPVPLCLLNKKGEILEFNQKCILTFGYSHKDIPSIDKWWEVAYPDSEYRECVKKTWYASFQKAIIENNTIDPLEYQVTCKNKELRNVIISGGILGDSIIVSFFDITDRKVAENKLIESERRLREAQELAHLGYWIWDIKSGQVEWSDEVYRIFRLDTKTFTPHIDSILSLSPWKEDHDRGKEIIESAIKNHKPGSYEQKFLRPDKSIGYYYSTYQGIFDENGDLVSMIGTILDITERKQAEIEREKLQQELAQVQKMESIGRLAGGIAHDFNNMLNVILGNLELIMDDIPKESNIRGDLEDIQNAAKRSADLTRQMLAFARKQTIDPILLNLNDTVQGMLKMIRRLLGEQINLIWKPATEKMFIKMDPSQIDQILVNLCVNARDAIRNTGKITIETAIREFDSNFCKTNSGYIQGKYAMIAVSDDGCGMDQQTLDNVFEPFFTTKDIGKGTGLGLATVYGIVKQNQGFVNVYSEYGHGTSFHIYLPYQEESIPEVIQKDYASDIPLTGSETILVVEDEEAILALTIRVLRRMGYIVLSANNPADGIRTARDYIGKIHLLITDIIMPEMNGRDLEKEILSLYPDTKTLFMSGYTAEAIAHHGVLEEGVNFIQKPFSISELSKKVRKALSE